MNINDRINAKYTKTYATYELAVKTGEKIAEQASEFSAPKAAPKFIVAALENGRFTPVFLAASWANEGGWDVLFFSSNGFYSI